jgi:parallel beta-helix repeat protein
LSKLIAAKFWRKEAKLTFILTLLAILLANMLVLLSRSTGAHGATVNQSYDTILNSHGFQDPWLNENWAKRRPVTINNSNNSNALENYQVRVNVTYDGGMRANFGDLRFSDNDGVTELCYWIENYNENENAVVWVKVPSIPANDNHTIYMYYGNLVAGTESNGSAVFEFFDNFDNSTKFSTVMYPYGDPNVAVYPNFVEFSNDGNEENVSLGCFDEGELRENLNLPSSSYKVIVKWRTGYDADSFDNADYTNYDDVYGASSVTPKRLIVINENKIYEKDNRLIYYSERTEVGYTGTIDNFYLSVGSSRGPIPYFMYYDLAFIRKFTDPEPVTSVGEEESNIAPSAPSLLEPANNAHENDTTPLFRWGNSIDPEGDSIIYTLQIDNDVSFSASFVYKDNWITENQYELPTDNALSDGLYYWRVGARDMVNPDNWSENFTFIIDTVPPPAPILQAPLNGAITNDSTPNFRWTSITIENSFPITYELQVDNDNNFLSPEVDATGLSENTYAPVIELADENYFWRVRAVDGAGNVGQWSIVQTFLIDTIPPGAPTLVSPVNGVLLGTPDIHFYWTEPGSAVAYDIQIDNEPSFNSPYVHENQSVADNSYIYTFARAGTYYWRVRASDEAGNWGGWSDNFKLAIKVAVWPGTPHNPIHIENDDFFNLDNGVVAGSGSEGEPYIIENWAISAKNANGIEVRNTTAHFIVRNCTSENGGLNNFGIYLENLANGRVENCKSKNNIYGIYLNNSLNNSINNNTSSNNQHGIYLSFSSNNTIANNSSSNNIWYGIALYPYSSNNTLENNTSNNNSVGIYLQYLSDNNILTKNTTMKNAYGIKLYQSDNTTFDNNTSSNNFSGIYLDSSNSVKMRNDIIFNNQYNFGVTGSILSHFVHDIDPSNLVNGKPIRYLVENTNEIIDPSLEIGYLALVNCDNISVENLAFRNNEQGVLLVSTNNSWVENCVLENNSYGAYLYSSSNNFIFHNNFLGNGSQARDDGYNYWDNGYPSGGNYWSNYTGSDNYRGENQDIPSDDGIGDTPYHVLGGGNADRYPFMKLWPPIIRVKISISPSYQVALLGAKLTYAVTVKSIGAANNTYNLAATDNTGWILELADNLLENLALGEDKTTTLTVTIPDNENLIGVEDNITVIATLRVDNEVSDNRSCVAYAIPKNATPILFVAGWNLVGFSPTSENTTPANVFPGLTFPTDYIIYYWNAPGGPYGVQGSNQVFKDNLGYWVWIDQDKTVWTSGIPPSSENIHLVAGWNLVHFPVVDNITTPSKVFAGLTYPTDYIIYYWNAPGGPYGVQGSNQVFKDNLGYWVWVKSDNMVMLP